jgi:hypothetical protein
LEEIDEMKSSTDVVTGAAATSATVAQAGAAESGARVCDADMSFVSDKGRATSPSPDNISGSTSAASKVRCTGLRGSAGRGEAPAAMAPAATVTSINMGSKSRLGTSKQRTTASSDSRCTTCPPSCKQSRAKGPPSQAQTPTMPADTRNFKARCAWSSSDVTAGWSPPTSATRTTGGWSTPYAVGSTILCKTRTSTLGRLSMSPKGGDTGELLLWCSCGDDDGAAQRRRPRRRAALAPPQSSARLHPSHRVACESKAVRRHPQPPTSKLPGKESVQQ